MSYRNTNPAGAKELLDGGDWTYLDVRSPEEYAGGHVPGAFNVPVAFAGPGGMQLNESFVAVVVKHFAKDRQLVVGCAAGGRSMHACELLAAEGFTALANMHGGFSGANDEAGWQSCGHPVETECPPERCWDTLSG